MPRPLFQRNSNWELVREWPKLSFKDQCIRSPFFLELVDVSWVDSARKTLESSPWSGFLCLPLVTPACPEISQTVGVGQQKQIAQECSHKTWKISLNVSRFCAEEISVKAIEGYLEITGKHKEGQDEHGIVTVSFTRKYKLPDEVDLHQMSLTLSTEGILLVEAPLGTTSVTFPAEAVFPIQMQHD